MTRYGEDLIWSNKITEAEAVLRFTVTLTEGRSDASELRKGKVVRTFFVLLLATTFEQKYWGCLYEKNKPRITQAAVYIQDANLRYKRCFTSCG